MANRIFGEKGGYSESSFFIDRRELQDAGVHAPLVAVISGSQSERATALRLLKTQGAGSQNR